MPIGSQIVYGCSCITMAEWTNCQKCSLSGPDQGIVCQHLFSMLSNSGEDREKEAEGPEKALWFSHNQKGEGEYLNMSLALPPPRMGPK